MLIHSSIFIRHYVLLLGIFILFPHFSEGKSERFRCIIRDEPATTICIGWDQVSGTSPQLYYGTTDFGSNAQQYTQSAVAQRSIHAKGMHNHFVRLSKLKPNTVYYFVVVDSEGASKRYSFRTLPDDHNVRLSIVCGGDSRNLQAARVNANKMVARLRPHFIMFNGDMTASDTDREWKEWMDDWQQTIGQDGRITAIVPARGNHEFSNTTLTDMFDVKHPDIYYGLTFGRGLLRVYSLNSMIPAGGLQRDWLERDLVDHQHVAWKFGQYHLPMRPHTKKKPENEEQRKHWAPLFERYKVQLVLECDAHVTKYTWPIRSSNERGHQEGFVRDDVNGVTYIGEGGWGAPLRENNDDKPWTRASASINQVKWVFVDMDKMEVRTVKTDNAAGVEFLNDQDRFKMPTGLDLWKPDGLENLTLFNRNKEAFQPAAKQILTQIAGVKAEAQPNGSVDIYWETVYEEKGTRYKIQYSQNKLYWKNIADLEGLGANVTRPNEYLFTDPATKRSGKAYYRIIAIDEDGSERFKEEVEVRSLSSYYDMETLQTSCKIGVLKVDVEILQETQALIEIYDINRKLVFVQKMPLKAGKHTISLNVKQFKAGNYLLEVGYGQQLLRKNVRVLP